MKLKRLFPLIIVLALALGGCSSRGQVSNWPGLAAEDLLYLAEGQVFAIDAVTHNPVWAFPEEKSANLLIFTPPAMTENGRLIVGGASKDNRLFALDAATGRQIWEFDQAARGWVAPFLVQDGIIYAPNGDGILYALDLDGNLLWTFEAGSPLWAKPVAAEENLYLTSLDHRLYALDLHTGIKRWEATLPAASTHAPAIDLENGWLYVGGLTEQLLALNMENGQVAWTFDTDGRIWQSPILKDGVLYFGDQTGRCYALQVADQTLLWQDVRVEGGIIASPLVLEDQVIFAADNGQLYAVSLAGEMLWSRQVEGKEPAIYTPPLWAAGEEIIVAPMNADVLLAAFSPTGQPLWTFASK